MQWGLQPVLGSGFVSRATRQQSLGEIHSLVQLADFAAQQLDLGPEILDKVLHPADVAVTGGELETLRLVGEEHAESDEREHAEAAQGDERGDGIEYLRWHAAPRDEDPGTNLGSVRAARQATRPRQHDGSGCGEFQDPGWPTEVPRGGDGLARFIA
jgi:hypothetical protein